MVFSSNIFLIVYLPIVLGIYYFIVFKGNRKASNYFLLIASLCFYAWGEPLFVFLMLISIVITWIIGIMLEKHRKRKAILVIGIVYHFAILFVFKYLSFLTTEIGKIYGHPGLNIVLPIGISFFTFQMMSYLFDVYYGKAKVQKNVLYLGLYVALFPQLIAGPIVRYETIENEILNRKENKADFEEGLQRFIFGLGKKVLVADYLALIADNVFALTKTNSVGFITSWIGIIAFTLEIYFDFSGYSDMAIGLGKCFGFHFKENFNYPYLATSVNDFWKRWHISLTDWFRDYVYIPLGGNRVTLKRHIVNTTIVWLLTGIWHGANWTYLLWGAIYCLFQIMERYVYSIKKWPVMVRRIYTLLIVCICWVIFKADSIPHALTYILNMLGRGGLIGTYGLQYFRDSICVIVIGCILSLPVGKFLFSRIHGTGFASFGEAMKYLLLVVILLMAIILSISGGYSPFIYFNF